jgi:hypothetical protein
MLKAKLHETRQCPSCGWVMRLQVDPESMRQMGNASQCAPQLQRYYECVNRACEHIERAS